MSKKTTINVKGMTCEHCETAVAKAVKSLEGVIDAEASHDKQIVVVTHEGELDEKKVKEKVAEAGYTFIS